MISKIQKDAHSKKPKKRSFSQNPNIFTEIKANQEIDKLNLEIDEKESEELRIISVILGNEEIINEINKLYPIDFDKENIDSMIKYLNYFDIYLKNNLK